MKKEEMSVLNTNDFYEGVSIIKKYWNQFHGAFYIEEKNGLVILELITGGWSENEEIIDILCDKMFWSLWWQESKKGGYYKFVYSEKNEDARMIKKQEEITESLKRLKILIKELKNDKVIAFRISANSREVLANDLATVLNMIKEKDRELEKEKRNNR